MSMGNNYEDKLLDFLSQMSEMEEMLDDLKHLTSRSSRQSNDPHSHHGPSQTSREARSVHAVRHAAHDLGYSSLYFRGHDVRFQLRLKTLGDLHRLLSAHLILDGIVPPNFQPLLEQPAFAKQEPPQYNCSLMKLTYPRPLRDKILELPTKPAALSRKLLDYLFHIYSSECCITLRHPDPAGFLESYYNDEIEPPLLHVAFAFAAMHLIFTRKATPILKQVRGVVGELLENARLSLEDAFDKPSPQSVLAFLSMHSCVRILSRIEEGQAYLQQSVLMALALGMDKDGLEQPTDDVQVVFRKRVWCLLCKFELMNIFNSCQPPLIQPELARRTVIAERSQTHNLSLLNFTLDIILALSGARITNIDWSLPDINIVHHLINTTAFLQREPFSFMQATSASFQRYRISITDMKSIFWMIWCNVWLQFLKLDVPPGRLETEAMQQLQAKALDEYIKGVFNLTALLQTAINPQGFAPSPFLYNITNCEKLKFIASIHPDRAMKRRCFQELARIIHLLRSIPNRGLMEQWILKEAVETFEEMKPILYTREELEALSTAKPRPLAIRRN
ncbi:uncharacterized protein VTP21DRAFT_5641 [Calcarisporiella thermophila]|uniref:uncharacterized protein n=1 Tax=Calcarisporiella thermophila TaxID=911321 RepID=UPI003743F61D